jgi:hypothetical protein
MVLGLWNSDEFLVVRNNTRTKILLYLFRKQSIYESLWSQSIESEQRIQCSSGKKCTTLWHKSKYYSCSHPPNTIIHAGADLKINAITNELTKCHFSAHCSVDKTRGRALLHTIALYKNRKSGLWIIQADNYNGNRAGANYLFSAASRAKIMVERGQINNKCSPRPPPINQDINCI